MTEQSAAVRRIIRLLTDNGFQDIGSDLEIVSIPFHFDALLISSYRNSDLIVIFDTLSDESELRRARKLESLSRALDAVKSRRPLTAIVVGPPMHASTIESMSRVARVLQTGGSKNENSEAQLRYDLAILLPLPEFQLAETAIDPIAAIAKSLGSKSSLLGTSAMEALIIASNHGTEAVQARLAIEIRKAIKTTPI